MQHKLTVILSADQVGYAALMERDEAGTLARLNANRTSLFNPRVAAHGGRIFKLMGDGALVEFSSAVAAVTCAWEIQQAMAADPDTPDRIRYRIGINLGEVIVEGEDIYGDGVNIAARLQALAAPGGVAVSRGVREQVTGKIAAEFEDLGEHAVKNIERAIHVFAVREGRPPERLKAGEKLKASVAVLPFTNLTGDPGQDYVSDGMAEELICALARTPGLKVPARTSSFGYRGRNIDVRKIASDLGVATVLEGSVRSAGQRIRVTVQLIDADTGFHLWSQNYDRKFEDLFALQDELAGAIAAALRVHLTPPGPPTHDLEAYQLYLRGRSLMTRPSPENCAQAVDLFNRAIERDPNFARAYSGKAAAGSVASDLAYLFPSLLIEAGHAAAQALALDPRLAEALAVLGAVHARHARWLEAEECFERALALDDGDTQQHPPHALYVYGPLGQPRRAVAMLQNAHESVPNAGLGGVMIANLKSIIGDDSGALDFVQIASDLGIPRDLPWFVIIRSQTLRRAGRIEEAREEMMKAVPPEVRDAGGAAVVNAVYGAFADPSRAQDAIAALVQLNSDPALADRLAVHPMAALSLHWYAMLGEMDSAYNIAERWLRCFERDGIIPAGIGSIWVDELRCFRQDVRFQDFARRLGFFPYWRKYGPPDGCELRGDELVVH